MAALGLLLWWHRIACGASARVGELTRHTGPLLTGRSGLAQPVAVSQHAPAAGPRHIAERVGKHTEFKNLPVFWCRRTSCVFALSKTKLHLFD